LRIVKGTAVYTSAFTPPTESLTAISGTILLTCQSNRFVDNSSNAHSITATGTPKVVPFSPFPQTTAYTQSVVNQGSVKFDGTGDYLSVASDTSLSLDGDFTIEWWMNRTYSVVDSFFTLGDSKLSTGIELYAGNSGNTFIAYSGDAVKISSSTVPAVNGWSHVALVRDGTTITMYLDGQSLGTWTSASATFSGNLYIAAEFYNSVLTGSTVLTGYISNFRVVKGSALYTADFTVPTEPLTNITNTSLLTCQANGFVDNSSNAHTITVNGNPERTTNVPFGERSVEFDGSSDYLTLASDSSLSFGTLK
jgi:hypothetical protein